MLAARAWLEPTLATNTVVVQDEQYRVRPEMSLQVALFGMPYDEMRKGFPDLEGSDLALARTADKRANQFVARDYRRWQRFRPRRATPRSRSTALSSL